MLNRNKLVDCLLSCLNHKNVKVISSVAPVAGVEYMGQMLGAGGRGREGARERRVEGQEGSSAVGGYRLPPPRSQC